MPNYRSRHRDGLIAATVRVVLRTGADPEAGCGTGVFVAPGLVLTCAHVVPDTPGGSVTVGHGTAEYGAEVLVREPADALAKNYSHPDVALLRVPVTDHPCVPLGEGEPPTAGRELFGYGCPMTLDGAFWEHMPMASEGTRTGLAAGEQWIKTSRAQVQPGASGSGVVDLETGLLAGMLKLSRDPRSDLGGVLVPTCTIVRTLAAAGHDVLPANRAAVEGYDTVGAMQRRLGRLLRALVNDLSTDVTPAQLSLMLWELGDQAPDPGPLDAALALLHVELRTLAAAVTELARACYSAAPPTRVLGKAAALAVLGGRAWVDPRAADLLVAERELAAPRVVQVPGSRTRTVPLYATRATTRKNVSLVELAFGDAEPDPATGLPASMLAAVRCELLRKVVVPVPADDPGRIGELWRTRREAALAEAGGLLFLLPDGADDADLLARLQAEFPPCVFLLATRRLRPEVQRSGRVLELPGALPVEVEQAAEERYASLIGQIVEAAG